MSRKCKCKAASRATENENIITAWQRYLAAPEPGADQLLRALDPLIRRAVGRRCRSSFAKAVFDDAAQAVRIKLIMQKFLLGSEELQRRSIAAAASTWQAAEAEKALRCLTNIVHMTAQWSVSNLLLQEDRLRRLLLPDPSMTPRSSGRPDVYRREMIVSVTAALRGRGYSAGEAHAIAQCLTGDVTQAQLGLILRVQQPRVSRLLRRVRAQLASVLARDDTPSAAHDAPSAKINLLPGS